MGSKVSSSLQHRFLAACLWFAIVPVVHAETLVTTQPAGVQVEARNAPLSEVLEALGVTHVRAAKDYLTAPVSGTYVGSKRQIIARVLRDYDYIAKGSDGKLAVIIYGPKNPNGLAASVSAQGATAPGATAAQAAPSTGLRMNSQPRVVDTLGVVARSQTRTAETGPALAPTAAPGGAGNGAAPRPTSAPPDLGALTRRASTALEGLQVALGNLPMATLSAPRDNPVPSP